jgi:predicted DCC family thiol-disulfide oxidoreductase YuxK
MILLYDSECQLCNRFKKTLDILDTKKTIKFISIYEQNIYIDYPELSKEECESVIHLIDDDKKIYRGSEVIEQLLLSFPQVKKFAWLIESESSKKAMNIFYKKLNQMREMKKASCYTCGSKKR